eukprot:6212393-Pleurochrysis_carterae.AAC.3
MPPPFEEQSVGFRRRKRKHHILCPAAARSAPSQQAEQHPPHVDEPLARRDWQLRASTRANLEKIRSRLTHADNYVNQMRKLTGARLSCCARLSGFCGLVRRQSVFRFPSKSRDAEAARGDLRDAGVESMNAEGARATSSSAGTMGKSSSRPVWRGGRRLRRRS